MKQSTKATGIKATRTTLDVIEEIREREGARTAELAAALGVARSTAHKHLKTLEQRGYVRKIAGEYRLGLQFLNLGEHARTRWPCYSFVREAVTDLGDRTDEDVDFVVEENGRVYTLCESYHKWEKYPDAGSGYRVDLGDWYYMHSVASGKAILATYTEEKVRAVVDRWGLPALTDNTITDIDELINELETVRDRGYAIGDEEYVSGLRTVSKAVSPSDWPMLGALSVSGPAYRMTGAVLHEEIISVLEDVVAHLERQIAEKSPGKFYAMGAANSSQDESTSTESE
jgi:IclR family acetate operon transcriptional repressor